MNKYVVYYVKDGRNCQMHVYANSEGEARRNAQQSLTWNCTITGVYRTWGK